jgi:hypothetical protein
MFLQVVWDNAIVDRDALLYVLVASKDALTLAAATNPKIECVACPSVFLDARLTLFIPLCCNGRRSTQ